MKQKAFTLIELLVVIAIIGLLSTIVLVSVGKLRAQARDARKQADFESISTALNLFYQANGRMPANNWCGYVCPGAGFWGACENDGYDMSMQELVDAGFLGAIPKSPDSSYCYYNYGGGNSVGAIIVTYLETYLASTTGVGKSCRPFTDNWCSSTIPSNAYCICNIY